MPLKCECEQSACETCRGRANGRKRRSDPQRRARINQQNSAAQRRLKLAAPEEAMWRGAKARADRAGQTIGVTPADIKACFVENCPACGSRLAYRNAGTRHNDSASLDKLIPESGYTSGNISIICNACNLKKNSSGPNLWAWCIAEAHRRGALPEEARRSLARILKEK